MRQVMEIGHKEFVRAFALGVFLLCLVMATKSFAQETDGDNDFSDIIERCFGGDSADACSGELDERTRKEVERINELIRVSNERAEQLAGHRPAPESDAELIERIKDGCANANRLGDTSVGCSRENLDHLNTLDSNNLGVGTRRDLAIWLGMRLRDYDFPPPKPKVTQSEVKTERKDEVEEEVTESVESEILDREFSNDDDDPRTGDGFTEAEFAQYERLYRRFQRGRVEGRGDIFFQCNEDPFCDPDDFLRFIQRQSR